MKTTKTISAMTFVAALCCASPVFAGRHTGAAGVTAGSAEVRSDSTTGSSFRRERQRSRSDGNITERERERENPNGIIEEQRQEQKTNAAGQTQTRSQLPPNIRITFTFVGISYELPRANYDEVALT